MESRCGRGDSTWLDDSVAVDAGSLSIRARKEAENSLELEELGPAGSK
jgi:hypothetical protein